MKTLKKVFAIIANVIVILSLLVCVAGCNKSQNEKAGNDSEIIVSETLTND